MELTEKEKEILDLVTKGHTNKEAAKKLFMSLQSFKWNLARLREKCGCNNTKELISFAYENELIARNSQKVNRVDPSQN